MLMFLANLAAHPMPVDSPGVVAPPVQITLNNDGNYAPGGQVTVRVRANDDGYLVVFRVDGDGHIRVLFPLDPDGDAFVRGDKDYELRGRGDRATFLADDRSGNGMVYAAISHQPFAFRDFAANGHWDYDQLRLRDSSTDAEQDLTDIVARMTGRARFDYDAIGYRVEEIGTVANVTAGGGYYPGLYDPYYNPRWRCLGCGWGYPGSEFTLGLDFGYSPYYDPWLFAPWGYSYGYGVGFGYYGGRSFFPGTYPVFVGSRGPAPGAGRPRPREPMPVRGVAGGGGAPPPRAVAPSAGASPGTRARPRPADMAPIAPPQARAVPSYVRPVFRQPPEGSAPPASQPRNDSPRPVYREPPHAPPPAPPPPQPSSRAPAAHSTPPPSHAPPPRGGGSGGRPRA